MRPGYFVKQKKTNREVKCYISRSTKVKKSLLWLTLFFLVSNLFSQSQEKYFRFTISDKSDLDNLTRIISIDNVVKDTVYAYANQQEWAKFLELSYSYQILPNPGTLYEHSMGSTLAELRDWNTYPTYDAYLAMMQQYAALYPNLCRVDTFGYSVQGRLLLCLVISDNVNVEEAEPEFMYTSSMHGDELVGYVLLLRLADYLLTNYGEVTTPEGRQVTRLVNEMEIWINPLFNPDGTFHGGNNTVTGATRFNANGVDLNRNFPDRIYDPNNSPFGRQPETQAMMALAEVQQFVLSANFHGGAQVVNYPWDNGAPSGSYSMCPDDAWYIALSLDYAATNPDLLGGGFPLGITNGCAWYSVEGGRQDWMYFFEGGREVTIELYTSKTPPGSALPQRWENNRQSFLTYLDYALHGIRGMVSDASNGLPIEAQIDVLGIPGVPVYSDDDLGDFYRLILPGTYDLVISAPHYFSDTLFNVVVVDSPMTEVDVALQPEDKGTVSGVVYLSDTTSNSNITVSIENQTAQTNLNGFFLLNDIFHGNIRIAFSKAGYSPVALDTTLAANDTLWIEATLTPTSKKILIVDDDTGERSYFSNAEHKNKSLTTRIEQRGASGALFESVLNQAGYAVERVSSAQTDPLAWTNYDFMIWSSGSNISPISNSALVNALISFVNNGGNLIIEGGEIGFDFENNISFRTNVLHITNWLADNSGSLIRENSTHPITANLPAVIPLNYTGFGDQDAVTPSSGATLLISNQTHQGSAGLIVADSVIYLAFNISAINQSDAQALIFNMANYLLPLNPIENDVAIYDLVSIKNGDMLPADSSINLSVILKNYGRETQLAGIPVELSIFNQDYSLSFQGSTSDSIPVGESLTVDLGNWTVPDTLGEFNLSAEIFPVNDQITSNNKKEMKILSVSNSTIFSESFEHGLSNWQIIPGDTNTTYYRWTTASWPVAGGWFSARAIPRNYGQNQDEWLISPQLTNPQKLYFYWEYGSDIIENNTLSILVSETDSLPASFTDTLLILQNGEQIPANYFSSMNEIDLSDYQNKSIYLAFRYQGNSGHYFAIDNLNVVAGVQTSIDPGELVVPKEYSLQQNFPNPFNPETTIRFDLVDAAEVQISIYNILGELVSHSNLGRQAPGSHDYQWNALKFSSGIYFLKLDAKDPESQRNVFSKTVRMVLIK